MITKVIGYSYGFLPRRYFHGWQRGVGTTLQGKPIVEFPWVAGEDISFPEIVVRDQYGWEDGCRNRGWRYLKGNVRILSGHPGDPYSLGSWILEADEVAEISAAQVAEILADYP